MGLPMYFPGGFWISLTLTPGSSTTLELTHDTFIFLVIQLFSVLIKCILPITYSSKNQYFIESKYFKATENFDTLWFSFHFTGQRQAQRCTMIFPSYTANQSQSQKLCFPLIQQKSYGTEHRAAAKFPNSWFISLGETESIIHVCQRCLVIPYQCLTCHAHLSLGKILKASHMTVY